MNVKRTLSFILTAVFAFGAAYAVEIGFNEAFEHAMLKSAEIKKADADLKTAEATVEKTYGMFDVMLDASMTYAKSRSEATSLFAPDKTEVLAYKASISEKIFTGGFISLSLDSARTTLYYPQANLGIPGFDPSMFQNPINPSYTPKASITYTQPLLKGFWGRPDEKAIKIGEMTTGISREALKAKIASQVSALKEAYYFVFLAQKLNEIQQKFYDDSEKYYKQAVSLRKLGLREEKDVLQTEASLISSRGELKSAADNVRFAKEMFLNMAGYGQNEWDTINVIVNTEVESVEVPETLTDEDAEKLAEKQPEIKMALSGLEMAKTAKEIADNNNLPSLNLFGSYGIEGLDSSITPAFNELYGGVYNNFAAGINFKMNLPDRGASGDVKSADASLDKAKTDYDFLRRFTLINIRSVYNKIKNAKEDYELKTKARQMQEKRLKLEERDFNQGKSGTRELLMAQTDYNTAMLKEMNALFEYAKAASAWNRINGKYDVYFDMYMKKEK